VFHGVRVGVILTYFESKLNYLGTYEVSRTILNWNLLNSFGEVTCGRTDTTFHCTFNWCTSSVGYVRCPALSLLSGLCSHVQPTVSSTAVFKQTPVVAVGTS
jgi:hypothetical protein